MPQSYREEPEFRRSAFYGFDVALLVDPNVKLSGRTSLHEDEETEAH
jgi:hypothetical protein